MKIKSVSITIIALLFFSVFAGIIPSVAAATTVARSVSSSIATPGGYVMVTLQLNVPPPAPSGMIIKENVPAGLSISNTDGLLKENAINWLLCGMCSRKVVTQSFSYKLNVPVSTVPGEYALSGTFIDDTGGLNNITGINSISVKLDTGIPGDADLDGKVSDNELLAYIQVWVYGGTSDLKLLEAIANWASH